MRAALLRAVLCLAFMVPGLALAQEAIIIGTVTDSDGEPLIGAQVVIESMTLGAATDMQGRYRFEVPALNARGQAVKLTARYIGFSPTTRDINLTPGTQTHDFSLSQDLLNLDEVVVTGVVSGTPQKKLAFTVGKVSADKLEEVPAVNIGTALQGKVAGVTVVAGNGEPGNEVSIRLRGSTSIRGGQEPLVIVDGVIIEGGLADINSQDIETIEVVKDAAAASLYGSRAANGVVQIFTKRGKNLAQGRTRVTVRNEYGRSYLANQLDLAEHHAYKVDAQGRFLDKNGQLLEAGKAPIFDDDKIADNPYDTYRDHQAEFFDPGSFYTNYVSVGQNIGRTNFLASFDNTQQEGIIYGTRGYGRQNARVNIDHTIKPGLDVSVSTMFGQSTKDDLPNTGGPFYGLLFMPPNVDITAANEEDGTPFNWNAARPYSLEDNPLYYVTYNDRSRDRSRQLANLRAAWRPRAWIGFEGSVGYDRSHEFFDQHYPRGYLGDDGSNIRGSLYKYVHDERSINTSLTAFVERTFGDLTTKFKASYLYEDDHFESFNVTGREFAVSNTPDLGATTGDKSIDSYVADTRAQNVFGIISLDYKDRYIADFLLRQDGSSRFGADERYHTYYRASAAYRLSEDFSMPGINEFKLRASIGTAGLRPPFSAQYETYSVSSGTVSKSTLGNKNLKPAFSTAIETGINIDFLDRFSFEAAYINNVTEDQILVAQLPAAAGYQRQWQNAGTLESNTMEATLGAVLHESRAFSWTADLALDRTRQTITELNIPAQRVGPGEAFYWAPGEKFGIIYGEKFLRDLSELQPQLGTGDSIDNYMLNEDGYVVAKSAHGKVTEKPIKLLDPASGLPKLVQIGDINPDFHLSLTNSLRYKGFSVFMLLDWKQGGDVYNNTRQWIFRELRAGEIDQTGKPDGEKKPVDYYSSLYNVNSVTNHFVEDGSYLKLREVSLSYTLNEKNLGRLSNVLQQVRFGVTGRNLFTFTGYSGYDPEVGDSDATNYAFDGYQYPNFRTFTGSIQLVF